jgi:hypothetical protein
MKKVCSLIVIVIAAIWLYNQKDREFFVPEYRKSHPPRVITLDEKSIYKLKEARPLIGYGKTFAPPKIENLNILGRHTRFGPDTLDCKVLMTLRHLLAAHAAEERLGPPRELLLSLEAKETGGLNIPNSGNDGGFGVIHKQPSVSREFGLVTYGGCSKLVDRGHGKVLRRLMEISKGHPEVLVKFDDRMHPIIDIDATARMLVVYSGGKRKKGMDRFQMAILRYAGRHNYPQYFKDIVEWIRLFRNKDYLDGLEKRFNEANPDLLIDGRPADMWRYLEYCNQELRNYELTKYRNEIVRYNSPHMEEFKRSMWKHVDG